jgi:hypothetical protein
MGRVVDEYQPRAGDEVIQCRARKKFPVERGRMNAAHGFGEEDDLESALTRREPQRLGGFAGRNIKNTRCFAGAGPAAQSGDGEAATQGEEEPAGYDEVGGKRP